MTQRLYQLPDILVIHIKRFNMTARFREKIRAKVLYPLKGLDMSPFCAGAAGRDSMVANCPTSVTEGSEIYDLYGVSNHIGGMNGGHYTAFVRFSSSTDIEFDDLCCAQVGVPLLLILSM
jgi:ubiquitin C-terminal hydrolase